MAEKETVVVTGGAGLVGMHLCRRLCDRGARVISLDNYFAGSRDNHVEGVEYREGHTRDIEQHIPEKPDLIFHLGEYARVEQSLLEPDIVHDLNIVGTTGVLDFWQKRKCKLVYAGSSTKFGDEGRAREATPYASTKAANTERVKAVGEATGLPYAITYFYNVYGPGERAGVYGTVIEAFRQMYQRGSPLTVTSPGTQERNFTHVDDIVDALIVVGEKGQGDEYGLGNERAYTILEVAQMFGSDIVMMPPRAGNRMQSAIDTSKTRGLGWAPKRTLEAYIGEFVRAHQPGARREKRVLVFSTTFFPIVGPAEEALVALMEQMPDVYFDIVTATFSAEARSARFPLKNARVHRVGFGYPIDKYLLPFLSVRTARRLTAAHTYLFAWSIMASYAALAGIMVKRSLGLPLLITLADQDIDRVSLPARIALSHILSDADQVYGGASQERRAAELSAGKPLRRSLGEGDAFANQLRYAYAEILMNRNSTI